MSRDAGWRWNGYHLFYHGDLDLALKEFVRPAVGELLAERLIDRFFFVRYTLGGPHLRLRCRLAEDSASAAPAVDRPLEEAAAAFLARWPSVSAHDPEQIREESRAVLAAAPEESALYYENNTFLPFPFTPEVDRYGGPELLEPSLDFFALSSAQALAAIDDPRWSSPGRRGALVLRLFFRQAWGFARSEEELLLHLGYHLPVGTEVGAAIWGKADRDFESRREIYRDLLRQELRLLAEVDAVPDEPAVTRLVYEAAKRLSRAVGDAPAEARWQIGHSQLHMTANRLGFAPPQEMHLQRILWRATRDFAEADPATWRQALESSRAGGGSPCASLGRLLESVLRQMRGSPRASSDEVSPGPPGESTMLLAGEEQ